MTNLGINHSILKSALTIRLVEEKFLQLFSEGRLNGTVHTCVGQEFSAIAFAGQLKKKDFVFSNHRCHGHYIAFTGDVRGLLAELMGKETGTCGGIGSSQHLCNNNFFSNGIQGGIVPVAAGYALGNKLKQNGAIGLVYIGDGTLGEGALYETMNIISKWEIPLLIVCENNFYAQSTPQHVNLAGDIVSRAAAFGISTFKGYTSSPEKLIDQANEAITYVRSESKPAFFLVETYRLNPHSKGDDDRDPAEIASFRNNDYLEIFRHNNPDYYTKYENDIKKEIDDLLRDIFNDKDLSIDLYKDISQGDGEYEWIKLEPIQKRQVELLNGFFKDAMLTNSQSIFIGEDILSPYGGAFKVARDLSFMAPERTFSTPISESAIMGIANGLALNGFKPYAEIMFGDFITLAFDQIVNHASKFYHMFNKKVSCPVVLRTPMGGRRGYGPTHSQTLDKFLIGIDNVKTIALNTFFDPSLIYNSVAKEKHPVIVIENKIDYGKKILNYQCENYKYERTDSEYPVVKISPVLSKASLTIVSYGGMADLINTLLNEIFIETDLKPELIVPSNIGDLPVNIIIDSVRESGRVLFVEEGSATGGIGAEMAAQIAEQADCPFVFRRIAALPLPIPSVKSLENIVLPDKIRILQEIKYYFT